MIGSSPPANPKGCFAKPRLRWSAKVSFAPLPLFGDWRVRARIELLFRHLGALASMVTQAGRLRRHWFWLGTALLPLALCVSCSMLFVTAQGLPIDSDSPPLGFIAGICVEWGANWAGRPQFGIWWEASSARDSIRPNVPPASSLHIYCGAIPWSPAFPTRGVFIYTH